jgi:hypothetical protein
MQNKVMEFLKKELENSNISEVMPIGEFIVGDEKPKLFPGSTYGFLAILDIDSAKKLFDEASSRNASNISSLEYFRPVFENVYPLYWGKDKSIGKRPYEHLYDPSGTGSIRLHTYQCLNDIHILCFAITVNENEKFEKHLQNNYPHLLVTKTEQVIVNE